MFGGLMMLNYFLVTIIGLMVRAYGLLEGYGEN